MLDYTALDLDFFFFNLSIGLAAQKTLKAEWEPPDGSETFCTSSTPTTSWHTEVQKSV